MTDRSGKGTWKASRNWSWCHHWLQMHNRLQSLLGPHFSPPPPLKINKTFINTLEVIKFIRPKIQSLTSSEKYFSISLRAALYTVSFSWPCRASILSSPPHSSIIRLSLSDSPILSPAWDKKNKTMINSMWYMSTHYKKQRNSPNTCHQYKNKGHLWHN